MRAEHDERTGLLRCDDEGLEALLGHSDGPGTIWADDRTHAALDAVTGALAQGRLVVGGADGVLDHRWWVAPGAAAFFLAVGDGCGDLVGAHPTHVPGRLARLVHLGPRRVDGVRAPHAVDPELLEDALHPSDLRRSSALTALDAHLAWRLDVQGTADDPSAERTMTVLDGAHGLWLVGSETPIALHPTTGTAIWRRLTTVLA